MRHRIDRSFLISITFRLQVFIEFSLLINISFMRALIGYLFIVVLLSACDQQSDSSPSVALKIRIEHEITGQPLIMDSMMYTNASGELYSVSRLQYFISNISLYYHNSFLYRSDSVYYIDAVSPYQIALHNVPAGEYDSASFNIGIDPVQNVHSSLSARPEVLAMEWPDAMGGGYHFLKLEGHWKSNDLQPGYTMHIGTNNFLIGAGVSMAKKLTPVDRDWTFTMDINQWFQDPHKYSFAIDGSYTMGNDSLMQKIADNGKDVFHAVR